MTQAVRSRVRRAPVEPLDSRYRVQVLDRTIAVLRSLAESDTDLPAAEIARKLQLHKSTVHRLLVVLERYRLIKRGPDGTYRLGTGLIELGERASTRLQLSERADPFLRELTAKTGEGAHVTVLSGTEMLSIAHVEGRWSLQSLTRTGMRAQIHCTAAGRAVLAFLPADVSDDLIGRLSLTRRTRRTIVKPSALKLELMRVRQAGYAVDDEEFEEGLRCVSAPVFDHHGQVVASISMAAPIFRLTTERIPQVARLVTAVAQRLSADIGCPTANEPKPPIRMPSPRVKAKRA